MTTLDREFSITERLRKDGTTAYRLRLFHKGRLHSATADSADKVIRIAKSIIANGGIEPAPQTPIQEPLDSDAAKRAARARITFEELFHEWLARKSRANAKTKKEYVRNFNNHVKEDLGHLIVAEITPMQGEEWQQKLEAKTIEIPPGRKKPLLAPKSVQNYRAEIVTPTAKYARLMSREGYPPVRIDNFMETVRPVEVPEADNVRLRSPREVALLCQCAYEIDWAFGDYVSLAMAGGFRFGEVVRLKPSAADKDNQSLYVREVRRIDEMGKVTVAKRRAKTRAGFGREVPIATPVWKAIVLPAIDRGAAFRDDLILPGPNGGMFPYSTASGMWERMMALAAKRDLFKEGMTMRNLRDTIASWYEDQDLADVPLKKLLGHALKKKSDVTIGYKGRELKSIQRSQAIAAGNLLFAEWTRG